MWRTNGASPNPPLFLESETCVSPKTYHPAIRAAEIDKIHAKSYAAKPKTFDPGFAGEGEDVFV